MYSLLLLVLMWRYVFNPFSTMTRFPIHSGDYLLILYSFRDLCGGLK
ncbi:hypothetical protein E2C01_035974 [Portunus trituberculatus]|uniref:Uncharacterized protein n=1 Tax=Portunus trituberculatus TaxID=210409 RepID=A0A5B7FB62_PORTR|nr:hypothetical protein [Portunus trituberculatus]